MLTRWAAAGVAGLAVLAVNSTASASRPAEHGQQPMSRCPVSCAAAKPATTVQVLRRATAKFHDIAAAEAAGYVPFRDVNGVSCISMAGMGGMGVHYVNPKYIADPAIRPTEPEALVYAPDRDGTLHLAALEYLVPRAAWDAKHTHGPELFAGRPFAVTKAPNRYGLPTFYNQHVWVWKANPAGMLAMWNPAVHCAGA